MEPDQIQETASIEEKEKVIGEQKKKFMAALKIFKTVVIGILILSVLGIVIKKVTTPRLPPVVVDPKVPDEKPVTTPSTKNNIETTLYTSDELKISFEYPINARIEEDLGSDLTKKVEVIYDEEGKEGYIFRVSTFTTEARDLEEVANVKRDSFISRCPETATVTEVSDAFLDTIEAKEFDVMNCDSHYEITYVPRFYQYYEFARVYKGDYGYWQQYKNVAADILDSVRFYPEDMNPKPNLPYEVFESEKFGIRFKHPKLSQDCCNITGPRSDTAEKVVTMYKADTFINNSEYDGIGVFVDNVGGRRVKALPFEEYMQGERQRLADDYVIIRGRNPDIKEESITLGDFEALRLSGATWEGNDLIYAEIGGEDKKYTEVVIIVIKNATGVDFEKDTIDLILESFEYVEDYDNL